MAFQCVVSISMRCRRPIAVLVLRALTLNIMTQPDACKHQYTGPQTICAWYGGVAHDLPMGTATPLRLPPRTSRRGGERWQLEPGG